MSDSSAWGDLPSLERPSSGSWLYQASGNLYGPVPTDVLLDRIRKGKLAENIIVCEDGRDEFVPIADHPVLKGEAEKAFAAAKELKARQLKHKKAQAKKTAIVVLVSILAVALCGGAYFGYRYYERQQALEAFRRKQDADALALKLKREEEKKAAAAAAEKDEIDVDLELLPLVSVSQSAAKKKKPAGGKKRPSEVDEGPQGCQLDQGTIATTFRGGFGNIKGCVRDQSRRPEALPEAITLSFTIANNGSVTSFETDDRNVRNGPFFDCLKRAVTSLHFPKFAGERCNIDYPITIGKKK